MGLRVLVCGGRDYNRYVHIYDTLDAIQDERGPFEVIIAGRHPGDPDEGADKWAESWSWGQRIPFYGFPARWHDLSHPNAVIRTKPDGTKYDAMAGPRRNGLMLAQGRPDLVVAFPGGKGTRNMLVQAHKAGVERLVIPRPAAPPNPTPEPRGRPEPMPTQEDPVRGGRLSEPGPEMIAGQPVTEMVSRAARAIDPAAWKPHDAGMWGGEYEARRVASVIAARAAIGALRNPPEHVRDALDRVPGRFGQGAWEVGIDAALARQDDA